jgi:alpha-tubulin suppressor-like RCC1 family protein
MLQMMNQFSLSQGMDTLIPLEIKFPLEEKAKKLVCSAALTLVLTESGKVYTFGANSFGQCGIGKESISVQDPELIAIGEEEEVVDIAAGYQHALAVTKNGAVFAWGKGERGQLGFGTANVSTPQEVIALKNKKVVEVSAGFNHSSALAGGRSYCLH